MVAVASNVVVLSRRLAVLGLMGLLVSGIISSPAASISPDASVSTEKECDSIPGTSRAKSVDEIEATLWDLRRIYEDLPGFIDVYYYAEGPGGIRPMFHNEVPAEAYDRVPHVPITFDVATGELEADGPGLLPTAQDILCQGIRPGSRLTIGSGICTANFAFTAGGNTYLGTAGHCISVGQMASVTGVGNIGTAVYSTGDGGVGNDFALIQVMASKVPFVVPEMCDWGGPTGLFTGLSILGRRVLLSGHGGDLVGVPPVPKGGVGQGVGTTSITYVGLSISGDSGSPIRIDGGEAIAIHTHSQVVTGFPVKFATRLAGILPLVPIAGLTLSTVADFHIQ